jgi:lactate racemase
MDNHQNTGKPLAPRQVQAMIAETVETLPLYGRNVLLIVPDLSRTAPVGLVYKTLYKLLADRVKKLDCMVALGTHPLMPPELICKRLEITTSEYASVYSRKTSLLNHDWQNPDNLVQIGTLAENQVRTITQGRFCREVPVILNRHVLEYDQIIIVGSVFPHEIAGFSGGNKYFFPGVSAGAVNDTFHWLGALLTNRVMNGSIDNPVRELIDLATCFIERPVTYFNTVMKDGQLWGLFPGHDTRCWRQAAEAASLVDIIHTGRTFKRVICVASSKYEDFWTAAKSVYKSDAVVADEGELIVIAPGIRCFSYTHEAVIRKAGYHPASWFEHDPDLYNDVSGTVLAHLSLARCEGSYECDGSFRHRIHVTLASCIDEETCRAANLGCMNPADIDIAAEKTKEDTLVIENAGDILYKP